MPLAWSARVWLALAGIAGAAGIALGAAAAHGGSADAGLTELSARYLLLHAPALAACAWLADRRGGALPRLAGIAFLSGMILFCGVLALRGLGWDVPGRLVPVGGASLIGGWLALALSAIPRRG